MTSVVCWLSNENPEFKTLWIASDSLISDESPSGSGSRPMLDVVSKISSVPVKIRTDPFLPFCEIYSVGFAFAGSTLVAMATKDTFTLLLGSLQALKPDINMAEDLPSLKEVAGFACEIFRAVLDSFLKNTLEIRPASEILIFGYCHKANDFECYKISHKKNAVTSEIIKMPLLRDDGEFSPVIIGDRVSEVEGLINQKRSQLSGINRERAPMFVLAEFISSAEKTSIGGHLQIAHCNSINGVQMYGTMDDNFKTFYNGYNPNKVLHDGRQVVKTLGNFLIAPPVLYYQADIHTFRS